jgi:hypothetical protein
VTGHVADRLSAYLDDALDGIERRRVEQHLRECGACTRHLEELLAVDEASRRLELPEPPDGYFEALPGRLRERARQEGQPRRPRLLVPTWAWAAAAAVLVAVIVPMLFMPSLMRARVAAPAATRDVAASPGTDSTDAMLAFEDRAKREAPADEKVARDEGLAGAPPATGVPPARGAADRVVAQRAAPSERQDRPAFAPGPAPAAPAAEPEGGRPAAARAAAGPASSDLARREEPEAARRAAASEEEAVAQAFAARPRTQPVLAGRVAEQVARPEPSPADKKTAAAAPAAAAVAPPQRAEKALAVKAPAPDTGEATFLDLQKRPATTTEEARALREAWRQFAAAHPEAPQADEARVRVVEAGLQAYRLGQDAKDRALAEADAAAYLERDDAAQRERVRRLLASLGG